MRRILISILPICTALCALAGNAPDGQSKGMPEGIRTDSIPSGQGLVAYTATASSRGSEIAFGIVWDYLTPDSYCAAEVRLDASNPGDLIGCPGRLTVYRTAGGERTTLSEKDFADPMVDRTLSMRLRYSDSGVIVAVGSSQPTATCEVTYLRDVAVGSSQPTATCEVPFERGAPVGYYALGRTEVLRADLRTEPWMPPSYAPYPSAEALVEAIHSSADPMEDCWAYLDRDTDFRQASLGGKYVLGCVRSGRGYDLVYLSGAEANAARWRPLRIKGHLEPTPFAGHYTLTWFDPWGRPLDRETTATLTDGAILTLNLPLYSASLRLQRLSN